LSEYALPVALADAFLPTEGVEEVLHDFLAPVGELEGLLHGVDVPAEDGLAHVPRSLTSFHLLLVDRFLAVCFVLVWGR
jgi:hypothetical protein